MRRVSQAAFVSLPQILKNRIQEAEQRAFFLGGGDFGGGVFRRFIAVADEIFVTLAVSVVDFNDFCTNQILMSRIVNVNHLIAFRLCDEADCAVWKFKNEFEVLLLAAVSSDVMLAKADIRKDKGYVSFAHLSRVAFNGQR